MKKKIIYMSFGIVLILVSVFVGFIIFNKAEPDLIEPTIVKDTYKNHYIYIDSNSNLVIKDPMSNSTEVLAQNIVDYKYSSKYIVYTEKYSFKTKTYSYNRLSGETEVILEAFKGDYEIYNDFLFYIDKNSIMKLNLSSKEKISLESIDTSDVVLHGYVKGNLFFSCIKDGRPTLFAFNEDTSTIKNINTYPSNIRFSENYLYGLNEFGNIYRLNSYNKIDTIGGLEVLSYELSNDNIVYMDDKGSLNCLTLDGVNRVIAENVVDFKVFNDNILYLSSNKPNTAFITQLTGNHKSVLVDNIGSNFNINILN
ncbi:hypothetical protein ACV3UL_08640 [Clostridium perfringens]